MIPVAFVDSCYSGFGIVCWWSDGHGSTNGKGGYASMCRRGAVSLYFLVRGLAPAFVLMRQLGSGFAHRGGFARKSSVAAGHKVIQRFK